MPTPKACSAGSVVRLLGSFGSSASTRSDRAWQPADARTIRDLLPYELRPRSGEADDMGAGNEGVTVLDETECLDLLARSSIGRVAVTVGAVPAVFPVNFAMLDEAIVFWTSSGTKLAAATRNAVVAFEIDEFDPLYHEGWSVLVVGVADELQDPGSVVRAQRLPLSPWAEGPREHLVAIRPEFVSGRRIVHGSLSAALEIHQVSGS